MANKRELLARRAKLIADARELNDAALGESRDFSAEEEKRYNDMLADADKIKGQIDREERLAAMESDLGDPIDAPDTRSNPGLGEDEHAEARSQVYQILSTREYSAAVRQYMTRGRVELMEPEAREVLRKAQNEVRALQVDIDTAGGYNFGIQTSSNILKGIDNLLFIRQHATVLRLEGASAGLGIPTLEANPDDADWTGEVSTVQEDSSMEFGKRELKPNQLSKLLKVSMKMMTKMPNIEGFVAGRLAYKFAVPQENAFLNGTGAGQPLGVYTASAKGISTGRDVASGHATQITANGLVDMKYAVKSQYWPKARWNFHSDAVKAISKLVDGDGQYLWRPTIRDGEPDMLLGRPIDISEYAPNTFTETSYIGLFGDWSQYYILDEMLFSIQVLNELFAGTNRVGFIGRGSTDGMPVLEEAFARMKLGA